MSGVEPEIAIGFNTVPVLTRLSTMVRYQCIVFDGLMDVGQIILLPVTMTLTTTRHRTFYCSGRPIYKNSVRRLWSYFYDHTHHFLFCGNLRTIQALAAEKGTKLLSDFNPSKDEITDQDIEDLDNDNKETTQDDHSKISPSQDNEETEEMTQEDILEN